ncbi:MAG: hypothetical protein HC841_05725 [Verrucomicrobiae bacterium]|nr:hypothetical protein [Verrucomicrobiae bacterium]
MIKRIPLKPATARLPYAHRGLHDRERGVIENSLPAFEAAIRSGFGIECDVRPSRDGTAMVFHDAMLDRLTAATGEVQRRSTNDLCEIPLIGSIPRSTIPTLTDLLALVDGRCPAFGRGQERMGDGRSGLHPSRRRTCQRLPDQRRARPAA